MNTGNRRHLTWRVFRAKKSDSILWLSLGSRFVQVQVLSFSRRSAKPSQHMPLWVRQ